MKVFYDWEFLERGPDHPIVPVSIGMVREDGAEYYAVNGSLRPAEERALRDHEWLGPNVFAHLPQTEPTQYTSRRGKPVMLSWVDKSHPDVKSREVIAHEVSSFCRFGLAPGEKAELWAYYADYDHVVLSQLFGRMVDLPPHMPMYTRDLRQLMDGLSDLEVETVRNDTEHHALADARWVRRTYDSLMWEPGG